MGIDGNGKSRWKQSTNGGSDDERSDEISMKQVKQAGARCRCAKQASRKEGKTKKSSRCGRKKELRKKKKKTSLNTKLQNI